MGACCVLLNLISGGSRLPADAKPLSPEEEKLYVDALQGEWGIEAIDASRLQSYTTTTGGRTIVCILYGCCLPILSLFILSCLSLRRAGPGLGHRGLHIIIFACTWMHKIDGPDVGSGGCMHLFFLFF